jgi:multidrug efflux pump
MFGFSAVPADPSPGEFQMQFAELFIKRPVLSSMVSLGIVLVGIIGYSRLAVREFPDADAPVVSVRVILPGASPQVMESSVTDVLEEELSSVEGVRTITSTSAEQIATITLEFNLDRKIEEAAQDVREKVSRVRGRLPEDIEEPVVEKTDADAEPIIWLALTSNSYDLMELSDLADRVIKPRLQTIPGVAGAAIFGERRFSMRVWLSPAELAARRLTAADVEQAIRTRSVELPAGRIESDRREFSVRYLGEMRTPEEFRNLTVSRAGEALVKLGDVARVEPGPEDERSVTRYSQTPGVFVGVVRQSKGNVIDVAAGVHAEIDRIKAELPPGVELTLAFDGSIFVQRSISEAQETLLITAVLVIIIIFLFLGTLRATVIPALAIPVSIIGTFTILSVMGYSINSLTLLGMILAIGIVVDDAIIVMENAYRHQEELHKDPETAAIDGTKEITTAVIATTISLIAVFSPLLFLTGATGRLFNEFGAAVGGSVLISGVVALTLTPMLCAKILKVSHRESGLHGRIGKVLDAITGAYSRLLDRALRFPSAVIGGALVVTLLAGGVFMTLQREFVPTEDRGFFFVIVIAPEGATVAYTNEYMKQVEAIVHSDSAVRSTFAVLGFNGSPTQGIVGGILTDAGERDRRAEDVVAGLGGQLFFGVPGVFAFAANPPAFGGFGAPVQFVVKHSDFETLVQGMDTLAIRIAQIPGLINAQFDLKVTRPELIVSMDRDRAEDLGVPARDIAMTLGTLLGGRDVARFTSDNKLYDVILRLDAGDRATSSDISGIMVRGGNGDLVPLDAVVRTEERTGAPQLNHTDRMKSFTLTAYLAPGFTLGQAIDSLRAASAEVLPAGSVTDLAGESRELEEGGNALYFAFILALIFVYMVLAAQFESLLHPFTVLLAVPLAVAGALFALKLGQSTMNVYSQVGMVLLIGLVSKNSILLVTYANDLRAKGTDALEAIREAGRIRLRPILMTSVAAIFGALPIALGLGAGAASRRPLGYAIIGGLTLSTLLTLFLVPVVFLLFERLRERRTVPASRGALATAGLIIAAMFLPATLSGQQATPIPTVTLREARQRASAVDPIAITGRANAAAAGWERRSAWAEMLTPQISLGASYTHFTEPFINFGTFEQGQNSTSATIEARYLLLGPGKFTTLRRAMASFTEANANETAARFRSELATDQAYYAVLSGTELTQVATDRLKRAEEGFAFARARVLAGSAVSTDSLQTLLELNRAKLALLQNDSAVTVARLALGRRIGLSGPAAAAPLDSAAPRELPITLGQAIAELRESGPEVVAARASENRASAGLWAQRERYLPDLSLSFQSGAFDSVFFPSAVTRSQVVLTASFPLWDAGRREVAVAQARAQRDIAQAYREEQDRATAEQMAQAWNGHKTAHAALELALVGKEVATANHRIQAARYREGATTILDLLEAQVELGNADAALVQARYAIRLSVARIEALLGRRLFDTRN